MEFRINNTMVYGLETSFRASGNPMRTTIDSACTDDEAKDEKRAISLGNTKSGEGHDQFLTGIIVQFDLYAPLYMWKQLQRYHFMDFISSQSTMHRLTKFNVKDCCVEEVDKSILDRYQQLLNMYNRSESEMNSEEKTALWRTLVASLPSGFVLGATMTTNYRQLKTIYHQRKNHKLKEWREFCKWCEELQYFKELCLGGN